MNKTHHRYLPMDIIELILLNLPSKSLLRFQTLSKAYKTTINHPDFIRKHLEQSRKNNNNNSFLVPAEDKPWGYCLAEFADREFQIEKAGGLKLPFGRQYYPLCSCDNNVLLIHSSDEKYILWNPINHTHREIPSPSRDFPCYLGIYRDQQTEDDYKVVMFFHQTYMVHSCKYSTWDAAKRYEEHTSLACSFCFPSVFFDGKLYVVGHTLRENAWRIMYFDPAYDSVKEEIEGPKDHHFNSEYTPSLVNVREYLCFCGYTNDVIQFWMLLQQEEAGSSGSWEKTICIDKIGSTHLRAHRYLSYLIEDDIVVCSRDGNYIVYNTLENRLVRNFEAPNERSWACFPLPLVRSLGSFLAVHA